MIEVASFSSPPFSLSSLSLISLISATCRTPFGLSSLGVSARLRIASSSSPIRALERPIAEDARSERRGEVGAAVGCGRVGRLWWETTRAGCAVVFSSDQLRRVRGLVREGCRAGRIGLAGWLAGRLADWRSLLRYETSFFLIMGTSPHSIRRTVLVWNHLDCPFEGRIRWKVVVHCLVWGRCIQTLFGNGSD